MGAAWMFLWLSGDWAGSGTPADGTITGSVLQVGSATGEVSAAGASSNSLTQIGSAAGAVAVVEE